MRRLLLIRHANPSVERHVSASEWPLSEEGRRRAQQFAPQVDACAPALFVTSDEPKAAVTGQILAAALDKPVMSASGLHEHDRHNVGWIDDPRLFQERVTSFFSRPDQLVFGAETAVQAASRFTTAVDQILAQHPQGNIAIVSHGTVMSLFVAQRCNVAALSLWQQIQDLGMPVLISLSLPSYQFELVDGLRA